MPDQVTSNGIEIQTLTEIVAALETKFKTIYGTDIVVTSDSPDGQIINIHAQGGIDLREFLVAIYNCFDPDQCEGVALDARCKINNIRRNGGSYSTIPVNLTVDRTKDLVGLDDSYDEAVAPSGVYTVQDDAGNEFYLVDSVTLLTGTTLVNFRPKTIGAVNAVAGTITTAKTVELGVTAINNPGGASSVGVAQETDVQLKIRRTGSLGINANGYINGLEAYVGNINGVTDKRLYENYTNDTVDGIPPHCIWLVVDGGSTDDIADAMYNKKAPGCDMLGDVEVDVDKDDGGTWTAKFDRSSSKNLHIRFDYQDTEESPTPDLAAIKTSLVALLSYNIGAYAETSLITKKAIDAIDANGGGGVPVNVEISKNGSDWFDFLTVDTLDEKWVVDTSRITIAEVSL